jgi:four helix bundle protein
MQTQQKPFRTFEDLEVYQVDRECCKALYAVNRRLPDLERFELASQIRRAAVSLTNNIAEGREQSHYLKQIKFCLQARGSLQELLDDLNVCGDERYLRADEVARMKQEGWLFTSCSTATSAICASAKPAPRPPCMILHRPTV